MNINTHSLERSLERSLARLAPRASPPHFAFVPSFELTVLRPSKCFRLASLARAANVCQNPTTARSLRFAPLSRSTNRFTRPSSIDDRVDVVVRRRPRARRRAAVAPPSPRAIAPRALACRARRGRAAREHAASRRRLRSSASRVRGMRATTPRVAPGVAPARDGRRRARRASRRRARRGRGRAPRRRRAGNPRRTTRRASPSSARSKSRRSARRSADGRAGGGRETGARWRWSCR